MNETLRPEVANGIKDGDLKVESSGFNSTTAQILPITEKGEDILGWAVASVTVLKSSLVGM